jgi:putative membrane protein
MAAPIQDFQRVLRMVAKFARTISYTLIVMMAVFMAFRVAEVYSFFADLNPWLGAAFLLAFFAALGWFVLRPVYLFLRMPAALKPPALPAIGERTSADLARHLLFVERYLGSLPQNPEWDGDPVAVDAAIERVRALREEAAHADTVEVAALSHRIRRLEEETVARLLAPLDTKVRTVIRQEALGVGIATAVSWNGTVDAFIVLWRNCNLISRIARIYYGRPGARGTLAILRDVSAAVIAGAYLQDLSEAAGSALGGVFGKTAGALGGPLLDGGLNGVATLRIGYVAKARCRSFTAWNETSRAQAMKGAFKEAALQSKDLVGEIIRTVGGGLWKVPTKVVTKLIDSVSGFFKKAPGEGDVPGLPATS